MEELKAGDVVKLKHEDYHPMTIESIEGNLAECVYFDKDGHFCRKPIELSALKKASY